MLAMRCRILLMIMSTLSIYASNLSSTTSCLALSLNNNLRKDVNSDAVVDAQDEGHVETHKHSNGQIFHYKRSERTKETSPIYTFQLNNTKQWNDALIRKFISTAERNDHEEEVHDKPLEAMVGRKMKDRSLNSRQLLFKRKKRKVSGDRNEDTINNQLHNAYQLEKVLLFDQNDGDGKVIEKRLSGEDENTSNQQQQEASAKQHYFDNLQTNLSKMKHILKNQLQKNPSNYVIITPTTGGDQYPIILNETEQTTVAVFDQGTWVSTDDAFNHKDDDDSVDDSNDDVIDSNKAVNDLNGESSITFPVITSNEEGLVEDYSLNSLIDKYLMEYSAGESSARPLTIFDWPVVAIGTLISTVIFAAGFLTSTAMSAMNGTSTTSNNRKIANVSHEYDDLAPAGSFSDDNLNKRGVSPSSQLSRKSEQILEIVRNPGAVLKRIFRNLPQFFSSTQHNKKRHKNGHQSRVKSNLKNRRTNHGVHPDKILSKRMMAKTHQNSKLITHERPPSNRNQIVPIEQSTPHMNLESETLNRIQSHHITRKNNAFHDEKFKPFVPHYSRNIENDKFGVDKDVVLIHEMDNHRPFQTSTLSANVIDRGQNNEKRGNTFALREHMNQIDMDEFNNLKSNIGDHDNKILDGVNFNDVDDRASNKDYEDEFWYSMESDPNAFPYAFEDAQGNDMYYYDDLQYAPSQGKAQRVKN